MKKYILVLIGFILLIGCEKKGCDCPELEPLPPDTIYLPPDTIIVGDSNYIYNISYELTMESAAGLPSQVKYWIGIDTISSQATNTHWEQDMQSEGDCYIGMKASVGNVPANETCELMVVVDGETVASATKPLDSTLQFIDVNYYLMKFK